MIGPEYRTPEFLELPARAEKPRLAGLTHVLDKGLPVEPIGHWLGSIAHLVDVWKIGYGLSYIDRHLPRKLVVLAEHGVKVCPGGTLTEVSWLQGQVERYLGWLQEIGVACVEVSSGATGMPVIEKRSLITRAAQLGFEVFSEVGSKDPGAIETPSDWMSDARADLEAGARWIVAEGRESGTVGLYGADGRVRSDLVAALEAIGDHGPVIYEAPRRTQQAWLITELGPDVNLGNVAVEDVSSVEALRLGLRADTLGLAQSRAGGPCST